MKYNEIIEYCKEEHIKYFENYLTSNLVTIKIGGIADIVLFPKTLKQLCQILHIIKICNYKYFIIGCGSNIFFNSNGYSGIVISTFYLNKIHIENNVLIAECGAKISDCSKIALEKSLSGLEFAYGIPGSVGGGIFMNAAAFDGKISDIVLSSKVFDIWKNEIFELSSSDHLFDSKKSVFMSNNNLILLESKFILKHGNYSPIFDKMKEYLSRRTISQPLNLPSAGSAFKRPKKGYASKMIDEAGLKGFKIGGAVVSNKHAGFIVNTGNATSENILELIKYIKTSVKEKSGIELEEEIIYIE